MMSFRHTGKSFFLLPIVLLLLVFLVPAEGCRPKQPNPGPNEVWIIGWNYIPDTITVPAGTTITWKNTTLEYHEVISDTGLFAGRLDSGATLNYTFTVPGTYFYHDESTDPPAIGKIIVN